MGGHRPRSAAEFASAYEREVVMSMACTEVSRRDPAAAIRLAIDYRLDENEHGLLQSLTTQWALDDLPGAREWVLAQPGGDIRDTLVASVSTALFGDDLAAATQLIVESIPPGESQDKAILGLNSRLALRDVESAREWLESRPPATNC